MWKTIYFSHKCKICIENDCKWFRFYEGFQTSWIFEIEKEISQSIPVLIRNYVWNVSLDCRSGKKWYVWFYEKSYGLKHRSSVNYEYRVGTSLKWSSVYWFCWIFILIEDVTRNGVNDNINIWMHQLSA